jgi:hypothetical protein
MRTRDFIWLGDTDPGTITIIAIRREVNSNAYQISRLSQAFYTRDFERDTLRHGFVQNVLNKETASCARMAIYIEKNKLAWPQLASQTWEYGSPEYDALLGSRIGKVIGYLVLGAYSHGTRRIARIVTWSADPLNYDFRLQFRFDIETFPTA